MSIDLNMIELFEKPRTSRRCNILFDASKGVPKIKKNITYNAFFETYLLGNQPCIIESEFTSHWRSRKEWVSDRGMPDFNFLYKTFGSAKVPVADCNNQFYNAQKKSEDSLAGFIQYWEKYCRSAHCDTLPCLYLKDWHFTRDFPNYKAYQWPLLFASDWLNEFWATKSDDYQFVYMGPKGSWTPLHVDVLTSYSWSSNICGRKRWLLFPPGNETSLRLKFGELPFDKALTATKDQAVEIEQSAGETIFVPSGWYHQVWNLEDTISINHNWLNGCCIAQSWAGLRKELVAVRQELADCIDMDSWEDQCQVVLRASTGTNLSDFLELLTNIAHTRIKCIEGTETIASENWLLGPIHARYDLEQMLSILPELADEFGKKTENVLSLKTEIEHILTE